MHEIDITSTVQRLREQRPKMVQTYDQYLFIYTCVREFINSNGMEAFKATGTFYFLY